MCGKFFKKNFSSVTVCFFLFSFLFSACGLESLYYLNEPRVKHRPEIGEDIQRNYFEFQTGKNSEYEGSGSEFTLYGTEIYYMIFANEYDCESSSSSIQNSNSSSDVSAGAKYIINTKKYMPLVSRENSDRPIVKGNDVSVRINLHKISDDILQGIYFNGNSYHPRRFHTNGTRMLGFEFNKDKNTDDNPLPQKSNEDVYWPDASTHSDGEWFIDVWAFTSGRDNSYTPSYSRAVNLGKIKIKESYFD